ncbi:MAG: PAS domain S-box protein [Methylobacter sp.]|nr:MAG: PAS domain S-box protein [Methylobacter sp.]
MKLGLKRKIVLVFIGVLVGVSVLDALLASYFTNRQNQDAAFATLKRDLLTWQDELQELTLHMRTVALSAIGETVVLNQLSALKALDYKLADALNKNKEVKEAARTLAFSKSVLLNRLHLVLRSGGFSAIAVYIDGKLSHRVSVSEVGMFVRRTDGRQAWVKASADGNGNLPIRSWPAWEEGRAPAVAASLASLDRPQVAFTYPSADSMVIEVAVPVEGVIEHSLQQGEAQPPELSVIDPHIAGSTSDASIFGANRPSSPFAMVVFQRRVDLAFLQAVERKTGMWPLLFSPDGQYSQQLGPLNLSLQTLLPELAAAPAGIKTQTVATGQGSFYAAALPWQFERQPGFVLALVASQDSTLQNIRQTVAAILTLTSLILAFSIGVGIFWVGRFIDPIIVLTHAVKAIGLGSGVGRDKQFEYRLTTENLRPLAIRAPGEVGDLAWAFDMMITELKKSFDTLEQRVQDRTVESLALQQILEKQNRRLENQRLELIDGNRLLQEEIVERKSAEALLRLREQEFRSLAENSPDNIARYDRECRIKYMNARLHDTLGIIDDAVARACIGKTPGEVFPDGRFDTYQESLKSVIETGLEAEVELMLPDTGDGIRYHLVRMVAERDQHGEVMGVLIMGRDITERKRNQRRMELLDRAINHSSDGIFLIDGQFRFTYVNDTACRSLGYSREELLTMGPFDIDPDISREVVLERRKAGGNASFETRHRTRNGRIFPVEISGSLFEEDGELFSLAVARDISERKQMEDALHKSRQILTEAQRIAHVGSWELDLAANGLVWSDEIFRIFEIDPERFGASYEAFLEVIHPDDRETVNRAYIESLKLREPYEIEHRLLMADGRIKYVLERCETRYADDGNPLYSLGTVQDITERKRMETELIGQANFQQTMLNAICDVDMQLMVIEQGRMIHVANRKSAMEFGFTDEELGAYPSFIDFVHPDDRARVIDYHVRREAGEEVPTNYELSLVTHNGERREYEISVAVVPGTVPVRTISISKNITERKRMEKELVKQANFQKTILNAICDVGMQVMVIEEDRIIHVDNRQLAWEFGFSDDELGTYPMLADIIHPDDRVRVMDYHVRRIAGEAVPSSYELGLITRDGERREYETSVAIVPNTDPVRMITVGKDISERKRMEKALAERERELRALAESSPGMMGSFHFRPDGSVCMPYVSANIWELFGLRPEDVADNAESLMALNHPADAQRVNEAIAESARTMTTWHMEYRILHPTRGERWMEGNTNPELHPDGGIVWYGYVHDITERKQAEEEKRRLIDILEQSADFIGSSDMQGNLLYHNRAARRMIGLPDDVDLSATHISDMHPAWAAKLIQETGLPAVLEQGIWRGDNALLHRDGWEIPVSQLLMLHRDSDGKPEFMATIIQDITERKRAEDEIRALNANLELRVLERTEELRRQTRYLRTMIDTLPMMAWLKDTDSRFLVVNQALAIACSHSVDDLVGKSDLDVCPRELAEAYRADDAEVMATGQRKSLEEPFFDAHNGAIWIETFKAPVVDEDGRVLGTVGVARDISERKAVEAARESALAEAERLVRLRSEFMARMSHELRTPLNGILGYTQVLQAENRLNERQTGMVGVIQKSGEHLLNLINDILDFAKIEAGKQGLSLGNVHLPQFLCNLGDIISVRAEQKQLAFVCDIAADVPEGIRADETRLRQVLLNLLSNAVKYTEQGQIRLRVTALEKSSPGGEPCRLRFEVQDSGIGIETGQLETIFKPFEQAANQQYSGGGTGLGLVISRELVRLMGSEIFVSSKVGKGSSFWFDLDAAVVDVCGGMMPVEQQVTGYRGPRQRVLVVDDTEVNRALLLDMLSRVGFEVVGAANGRACLDSAKTQLPDLILLDMVMPEMDGLEAARCLRSLPGLGQTPIIAVSSSASGIDVAEAMDAGVSAFLSKPIKMKRMMAQIGGLLNLDWIYALPEAEPAPQSKPDEWLDAPPMEDMQVLHQLALEGSMKDIIHQTVHLEELDERYRPFAEQLRKLSQDYQSKAVLDLVERYINIQPQIDTDEH